MRRAATVLRLAAIVLFVGTMGAVVVGSGPSNADPVYPTLHIGALYPTGLAVPFDGTGFTPGVSYDLTGVPATITPSTVVADASGDFQATATIPAGYGNSEFYYWVTVTGQTTRILDQASPISSGCLTVSRIHGPWGIQLTGHAPPGTVVPLQYSNPIGGPSSLVADANGLVSGSFEVALAQDSLTTIGTPCGGIGVELAGTTIGTVNVEPQGPYGPSGSDNELVGTSAPGYSLISDSGQAKIVRWNAANLDAAPQTVWTTPNLPISGHNVSIAVTGNGDLVLTDEVTRATVWSAGTAGTGTNNHATLQADGDLVLYTDQNKAVWSSAGGVTVPSVGGTGLLTNGGFESGTTGWSAGSGTNFGAYPNGFIAGESALAGGAYAATNTSVPGGGIYQDVTALTINPSDRYCANLVLRSQAPSTGAAGSVALWLLGGSTPEVTVFNYSALGNGTSWTPAQLCVTATTSHTSARLQIYPQIGSPTVEADAAQVTTTTNLLRNGGFESGASNWSAAAATNFGVYSNGQVAGESALSGSRYAATNTPTPGGGIYQDLTASINPGDMYCATAFVRAQTPGINGSGTFMLWVLGGASVEDTSVRYTTGSSWSQVRTCVGATTGHTTVRVQFYPDANVPTLEVDDAELTVTSNLLANPGFENGTSNWTAGAATNFVSYPAQFTTGKAAQSGTRYGAANVTSSAGGGVYQDVVATINPGDRYCAGIYLRSQFPLPDTGGEVALWLIGGGASELATAQYIVGGQAGVVSPWQQTYLCVTATTVHTAVRLQIYPWFGVPTVEMDDGTLTH